MSCMAVVFNGATANGQFLGDTLCSIKAAWVMALAKPCDSYLLTLSPAGELNFLWKKWIDHFKAEVIYDALNPGDTGARWQMWDLWRQTRQVNGIPFDHYRELYKRVDGGIWQHAICGSEVGLGRKNIFEYMVYGQEEVIEPVVGTDHFRDDLIDHDPWPYERDVFIAPEAKCQGNAVFTRSFWEKVVSKFANSGFTATVNTRGAFCDDNPNVEKSFVPFDRIIHEVKRHRLVVCGNTGVMWVAGACGIPFIVMQHDESNMQDYRAEWCGIESMVEFVREPDHEYVAGRIVEELFRRTVLTTGCFDLLHAGHVRHLEESRSLGDRLVVALNADASVRRSKGEGRPVRNEKDRAEVLKALRCVDDVVVFDGADALPLIHKLRPQVLTNGSDHRLEEVVGKDFVESYGGKVVITNGARVVSTTKIIQKITRTGADIVKACKDAERFSVNPYKKLRFLADQLLMVENVPGDLADLGSYKGGCALVMKRVLPDKTLHLFDTWDGMKEDDPLCHHRPGEWKWGVEECKLVVGKDARTNFHKGIFPETAGWFADDGKFALVYVDLDTYQSTLDALRWFWPRLEKGGRIVVDDIPWLACAGTEKAVREFFSADQIQAFPEVNAVLVVKT